MEAKLSQTDDAFYSETKGDVLVFHMQQDVSAAIANELSDCVRDSMRSSPESKKFAVMLRNKYLFDSYALRSIGPLCMELKKHGAAIYVLEATGPVRALINDLGMSSMLKTISSLSEISETAGAETPKPTAINVEFINPFIDGAINTLKVQCSLECRALKLTLKENAETASYDITGVIGITSEAFCGSIAICFPAAVFLGAMSNMLGEECKEITKDLEDGAGELLNIIFGHAKTVLNEKGYALTKAIPTIVRGKGIEVKHLTVSKTVLLPFETKFGCFYIEIGTDPVPA